MTSQRPRFSSSLLAGCLALGAIGVLAPTARAQQAAPFALHNGDRVVFYGDSITEQRLYTNFTEDYIVTRFPHLHVKYVNSGWGGDRVTGGGGGGIDLRLQRDVIAYKPTVVTIMLGMNDGGYHADDQKTYDTYTQGYIHIVDTLRKALPGVRITLIEPSPYDDVTQAPQYPGGYNGVLKHYSEFVKQLGAQDNLTVADFNTAMVDMLTKADATDPATAQKIIPGRVHPSPAGHLVMAEALLKAWNAPSLVANVEINATDKSVVHADNSRVQDVTSTPALAWTETDNALPMPVQWHDPVVALVMKSSDFIDALDQENLKVDGLDANTTYALKIDGDDVAEWTGQQLADGVNLALASTPMFAQATDVADLTNAHVDEHFTRWRTIQVPLLDLNNPAVTKAMPPLLAALDKQEDETVAQRQADAQSVAHHYTLTPALPTPTGPDLAVGKPYTTSAPNLFKFGIGGLTDGSWVADGTHTFATDDSANFPKTATVDLGASTSLGAVEVGVPSFGSTKTVEVSLSPDGQTFTPVGRYIFSERDEERHMFKFPATSARYIRLTYLDHYEAALDYTNTFAFTTEVAAYAP
jgi:lysophospholipase L1-like esterase